MDKPEQSDYQAYLLRLWRDAAAWRATVESPHTGERHTFATLHQLVCFLEEQTGEPLTRDHEP